MSVRILGMRVDDTSYARATQKVVDWAMEGGSHIVCVANVHMVMEVYDSPDFRELVNSADLVTPDGMPLVWAMRRMGYANQQRVYGPELTLRVVHAAAEKGLPVGFYGGTPGTLEHMVNNLTKEWPKLKVAFQYSPPFRMLTPEEGAQIVDEINASGARVLFVGLGCPKQERWMAAHRGRVRAVMLGVGAAFDLHAKARKQAPRWVQRAGLEWLFRLFQEPRRLWKRYLYHNPRFIALLLMQLSGFKSFES